MRNYEVTFIVDPVLSGDEIKGAAQTYVDMLQSENCKIVHVDEMGLRQLAYPINRRNSGVYYCVEFEVETGEIIGKLELAMQRDERIIRFLTAKLDKYGVKYNADKRAGLIGKKKKKDEEAREEVKRAAKKQPEPPRKEAPAEDKATEVATEEE
jgi:small subunit ribosomal protein S6